MVDYKSMKIPIKIWNTFDAYIKTHTTLNDSATTMIHEVIKNKAKELLQEMIKEMEEKKANWETVRDQLDSIS
ncbi:hypothetical protein NEF87_000197 [Candidatus Lokiarchaeum ossiferum]|uniref:CopG family transcriptional regulator n=1 Tax=Candidatus Lokiarchaeum ossiferum TaxID=2951803 RepID=A0ABY6HND6_9ARCH|nr:hypothetical protein NEF87_000197 [Candidatus Lokiarchaeum sp. B-35]